MKDAELATMMDAARIKNVASHISGLLMASGGYFLQVLEGPQPAVSALYEKITADSRHGNVTRLFGRPTTDRTFPEWGMKLVVSRRSFGLDHERIDKTLIHLRLASDEERSQGALLLLAEFRQQMLSTAD